MTNERTNQTNIREKLTKNKYAPISEQTKTKQQITNMQRPGKSKRQDKIGEAKRGIDGNPSNK